MNGDIKPIEIMARREDWQNGISLYCRQVIENVSESIAQPVVFEKMDRGLLSPPFLTLGIQSAQNLMDELWQCGVRPTEGTGSAGSLGAVEKHLSDMRKIAFKNLKIKP